MPDQPLLEYLLERLPPASDKPRLAQVARDAAVPFHTLLKIVKGETTDPRLRTVQNLLSYYRQRELA